MPKHYSVQKEKRNISATINISTYQAIRKIAYDEERSMSSVIDDLLELGLGKPLTPQLPSVKKERVLSDREFEEQRKIKEAKEYAEIRSSGLSPSEDHNGHQD